MATAETEGPGLQTDSLGGVHWIGILAALVSAAIHLLLGIRMLPSAMGISFVLAGAGFLGAIGLVLVGYRRKMVYAVGIPFVAVQIVLWFVVNFVTGPKSFPSAVAAARPIS
ncbi:MAG: DUF7475 family protein, partial [Halovenus sp.]